MHKISKSTIKSLVLLFGIVFVFISAGLYHINQFETSDEHFWRLERVPQYWTALKKKDLKQTYINDKPGVSVALISGTGLPFVSQDKSDYNSIQDYTMTLNYTLRLPILLFNGLVMLPLLFWLLFKAFDRRVASIGIVFIGINPILIGISQIINPDALLWSFSAGALFSFFALLKTNQKKFIVLTGVLTGFALLSKYTANLLFIFYLLISVFWILFENVSNTKQWLHSQLKNFLFIFLISILIFIIFLPAIFTDINILFNGTIFSTPLKPIIVPITAIIALLALDIFLFSAKITQTLISFSKKFNKLLFIIIPLPLLIMLIFALINTWLKIPLISLDNLKEIIANSEKLVFPMLEGLSAPIYFAGEIAIQSFNIIFSLTPSVLIVMILTLILMLSGKINKYKPALLFCVTVPFLFFVGGLVAEVFVNVRYAILLQPIFALFAAIGLSIIIPQKKYFFTVAVIMIFIIQEISVYLSSPYYFNYQNVFLPQKYVLTDSWSYGIFEAVQYLNSLPNAEKLTIWSDRKAACYYFVGECIMRRKIDTTKHLPDYFIVTRRGVLRHHFKWLDDFDAPYSIDTVYSEESLNKPFWQYNILNRPQNYIKIIDARKLSDLSFVQDVETMQSPTFPNTTCNILDFGAHSTLTQQEIDNKVNEEKINEEKEKNTQAFANAIAKCYEDGGGIVEVPSGLWLTKAIHLKDNINLHISNGATILFSDNPDDFLPVIKTRFVGLDLYNYSPMIYVADANNLAITGTGTIDGNGKTPLWDKFIQNQRKSIRKLYKMSLNNIPIEQRIFGTLEDSLRPSMIQFYNSQNILIDGITIKGGPMWTIHPVYSKNIVIKNTSIKTQVSNGDGIAIDSSENVLVENNNLSTNDDAIVIKSGRDADGWNVNKPSQNIVIKNNAITRAHAGIGFGSEMSGGIKNVFINNINITNATRGFRFKTTPGRGGYIKNITIQNSSINNPQEKGAININMDYGSNTIKPKTKKLPQINNIKFKNIKIKTTPKTPQNNILIIDGIKDNLSHLFFNNITTNNKESIATIENAEHVLFNDVNIQNYSIKNSKDVTIVNETCPEITQKDSKDISNICK